MAKALFGHVGVGPDPRLAQEVRRLRARVAQLEGELGRVTALNESLLSSVRVDDDLLRLAEEPALT